MESSPITINTLVLVDTAEQAERIAETLRHTDVAISQSWVSSSKDFASALKRDLFDLGIIYSDIEGYNIPAAILRYPDLPVLAVLKKYRHRTAEHLSGLGVSDVVGFNHPERLQRVIHRTLAEAHLRAENRSLRSHQQNQKSMVSTLLHNTQEAVAYVHQGMHSFGNPAYQQLVGIKDVEHIVQTPLLDIVTGDDHEVLAHNLKQLELGKSEQTSLGTRLIHKDGNELPVTLTFTRSWFDEESVLQMIASPVAVKQVEAAQTAKQSTMPLPQIKVPMPALPETDITVAQRLSPKVQSITPIGSTSAVSETPVQIPESQPRTASVMDINGTKSTEREPDGSNNGFAVPAAELKQVRDKNYDDPDLESWSQSANDSGEHSADLLEKTVVMADVIGTSTQMELDACETVALTGSHYEQDATHQSNMTRTLRVGRGTDNDAAPTDIKLHAGTVAVRDNGVLMADLLRNAGLMASFEQVTGLHADDVDRHRLTLTPDADTHTHMHTLLGSIDQQAGLSSLDQWLMHSAVAWQGKTLATNALNQLFVPIYSDLHSAGQVLRSMEQHLRLKAVPSRSITVILDLTRSGSTAAERINFAHLSHDAGFGVCYKGLGDTQHAFKLLKAASVDYVIVDHVPHRATAEKRSTLKGQLQRCRRNNITTIAEITGPDDITDVWQLGFDCFFNR